jgi:hypothetical protein
MKASADNLADYLGVPKYRYGEIEDKDLIGVVTGLAWTDVGGELLTIEAAIMPGKGRMTATGNLRDVMKESISAAASYEARSHRLAAREQSLDAPQLREAERGAELVQPIIVAEPVVAQPSLHVVAALIAQAAQEARPFRIVWS